MTPLLDMRGIEKQYPGVQALKGVDFELSGGEVHCLVGENGAGKSTLMKILSGAEPKDGGEIWIDGSPVDIKSPADAQQLGISIIYQDFRLVPELSVAENICLGREPRIEKTPFVDRKRMTGVARMALEQLGEDIDPSALVRDLSVAQQQIVEIAKAISRKARILAMDEPSSALSENELRNLFKVIRRLKSEDVGVIYISHRLEEIFEVGDRVTVLRDGQHVHTCSLPEAEKRSLIRWMVGRELEQEFPKVVLDRGEEILRVEHLSAPSGLHDISFTVCHGEIFGLAGLVGAGRSELARAIFGADPITSGKLFLERSEIRPRSPRDAIDLGVGLLTEDRNRYGLVMEMSVRENISLSNLVALLRGPLISRRKEHEVASRFVRDLRIKTPTLEQRVEYLSGGNRQKVVLARWLYTKSKILIFDEPTAGIDVGVKYEIYNLINKLAKDGIGIILISSELPELIGMCDRIAVMSEGEITGILGRNEASQERIMVLATGGAASPLSGSGDSKSIQPREADRAE